MNNKCDVCGTTEGVECEILTKGTSPDRIYHLCPEHWVAVYRKTLEDFLEHSEYKVNSYIKMAADKIIVDARNDEKVGDLVNEDGTLDVETLEPREIRRIRPYEPESEEMDHE